MLAALLWVGPAQAQNQSTHSVTDSGVQFFVGNGLPIPIPGAPFPFGGANPCTDPNGVPFCGADATANATVKQDPPGPGGNLTLPASLFTRAATPAQNGLRWANVNVFNIRTSFSLAVPAAPAVFANGGRIGAQNLTFCPGIGTGTIQAGGNPMCIAPGLGNVIGGRMKYAGSTSQFGGAAPGIIGGTGTLNVVQNQVGPLNVSIPLAPGPVLPAGGTFGLSVITAPVSKFTLTLVSATVGTPNCAGGFIGGIPCGTFVSLGPTQMTPAAQTNTGTSAGGPWTTGMVTMTNTFTPLPGGSEMFTLTGADNRTGLGGGNITLVSGAVSYRSQTLGNANRGIMTLVLPEPGATLAAAASLATLVVCHRARRRRPQ